MGGPTCNRTGSFQSPLSYKSLSFFYSYSAQHSRLEGFEVSLGARTRHRRSPFKFLVCAILTFSSDQTTTRPTGRTSIHQTTNRSTLSVSNQLLVFYFATVSFSFFLCVFIFRFKNLALTTACVCVFCVCVLSLLICSCSAAPNFLLRFPLFQIIFASYILKYNNRSFYHY